MEVKNNKLNVQKKLTDREKEVLKYVMQGLSNKEIAKIMMITHHTVKAHIASIMRKFGAKNRLDAAMIAHTKGFPNHHQD